MKTRTHFVSNSSSSSFVCSICKHTEAGMDMSIDEANMTSCEQAHTICIDHLSLDATSKESKLKTCIADIKDSPHFKDEDQRAEEMRLVSEDEEYLSEYYDELIADQGFSSEYCPICKFHDLYEPDAFVYLMNKAGLTKHGLAKQLKDKFSSYKEFNESLNKKI